MKPPPDKISKEDWKRILAEEEAILDFTEETLRRMEEVNVTRTGLAEKLGVDPAAVTKLLGGKNNFTLRTMVRIARALKARLRFSLAAPIPAVTWKVWDSGTYDLKQVLSNPNTFVRSGQQAPVNGNHIA